MERRDFLKMACGVVAGAAALAASAQAAPLMPQPLGEGGLRGVGPETRPAVTTGDEVDRVKPEEVRWGWHGRHWGWRHRHWGWHRRRWHHRHWRRRYW